MTIAPIAAASRHDPEAEKTIVHGLRPRSPAGAQTPKGSLTPMGTDGPVGQLNRATLPARDNGVGGCRQATEAQ
jgi:hypothetical protein